MSEPIAGCNYCFCGYYFLTWSLQRYMVITRIRVDHSRRGDTSRFPPGAPQVGRHDQDRTGGGTQGRNYFTYSKVRVFRGCVGVRADSHVPQFTNPASAVHRPCPYGCLALETSTPRQKKRPCWRPGLAYPQFSAARGPPKTMAALLGAWSRRPRLRWAPLPCLGCPIPRISGTAALADI